MMRFGVVHGRFQPFHKQHLEYVLSGTRLCDHLVIGITNPFPERAQFSSESPHRHTNDANPYNYFSRYQMIRNSLLLEGLAAETFTIVPLCLFATHEWNQLLPPRNQTEFFVRVFSDWERKKISDFRSLGYSTTEIDRGVKKRMTATEVRDRITHGGDWPSLVPAGTLQVLLSLGVPSQC